jgi:hypothetical protein
MGRDETEYVWIDGNGKTKIFTWIHIGLSFERAKKEHPTMCLPQYCYGVVEKSVIPGFELGELSCSTDVRKSHSHSFC